MCEQASLQTPPCVTQANRLDQLRPQLMETPCKLKGHGSPWGCLAGTLYLDPIFPPFLESSFCICLLIVLDPQEYE